MKKLSKKQKILIFVLLGLMVCLIVGVGIFLYHKYNQTPLSPNDNNEETNTDENKTVVEFYVVTPIKDEYYLNEYFNINDIEVFVKFRTNEGFVTNTFNLTTDFIKGYPNIEVPNTSTLGPHSFTIIYLDGEINISYNVVEFNEKHCLFEMLNKCYIDQDSMFSKISVNNKVNSNLQLSNYIGNIYDNIVQENGQFKTLSYANIIYNGLKTFDIDSSLSSFCNPNSDILPSITKNNNQVVGKLWWLFNDEYKLIEFSLDYNNINNGIYLNITVDGKTTSIISNYLDDCFNMVITNEDEYDILINYSSNHYYIAKDNKNLNNDLNTKNYSETFASLGIDVFEYDVLNNVVKFNNVIQ